jgi:hypothetical protein
MTESWPDKRNPMKSSEFLNKLYKTPPPSTARIISSMQDLGHHGTEHNQNHDERGERSAPVAV